ncbi:MAG: hypothetical protein ABSE72_08245 [Bacteroidales bacterium]
MKTIILVAFFVLSVLHSIQAQKYSHKSLKLYNVWVSIINNP